MLSAGLVVFVHVCVPGAGSLSLIVCVYLVVGWGWENGLRGGKQAGASLC